MIPMISPRRSRPSGSRAREVINTAVTTSTMPSSCQRLSRSPRSRKAKPTMKGEYMQSTMDVSPAPSRFSARWKKVSATAMPSTPEAARIA